jgi:uncharacterized protein YecE (DUF72 family)
VFSIKASRGLTQFRELNDPAPWLERMDAGLRRLGDKMGVLVFQLPPHFPYNPERLAQFLRLAPSWPRLAIEFRQPSCHREESYAMLASREVAYCVMSGANLPCVLRATAPFVYVRLHGPDPSHLYGGCYSDDDLRWWADRLREWDAQGRDVYAHFNNDGHAHAVRNAETLRAMIGSSSETPGAGRMRESPPTLSDAIHLVARRRRGSVPPGVSSPDFMSNVPAIQSVNPRSARVT